MVSMYPNSQAMAYEISEDGVFTPCPPSSIAGSSSCPSCSFSNVSPLSLTLERMGFAKFGKIVEISGLQNLDCGGITLFAPCDALIPDEFVASCKKLEAINIVKASSMERLVPAEVLCQRKKAKYGSLHKIFKLEIICTGTSIHVSTDGQNPVNVLKINMKDAQNPDVMVHSVDGMLHPQCVM
jgi:hypothetical protein